MDDPDITQFRFSWSNVHNRDMLEYRAEEAFRGGAFQLAAQFSIAAALYALVALESGKETPD